MASPISVLLNGVRGHLSPHEVATLYEYSTKVTKGHIVEIGSFQGLSTMALAMGIENKAGLRVYAIDPHDSYTDVSDVNPNFKQKYGDTDMAVFMQSVCRHGLENKIFPVALRSDEVTWERDISILFIDGAHDYASVLDDFKSFEHWIVRNGYVIFHDSEWPGPKEVIKHIQEEYSDVYTLVEIADALTIFVKGKYSG